MRRRHHAVASTSSAENVAAVAAEIRAEAAQRPPHERARFIREALAARKLDPVQVFRARLIMRDEDESERPRRRPPWRLTP